MPFDDVEAVDWRAMAVVCGRVMLVLLKKPG